MNWPRFFPLSLISSLRTSVPAAPASRMAKIIPFARPFDSRNLSMLSDLKIGQSAILVALDLPDSVQNHLMHMGFVPDARVTALRHAPAGDPTVYAIDGMEIALRRETASSIRIRPAVAGDASDDLLEAAR